jgi:hypothetical protein
MATRTSKTSTVKAKPAKSSKTSAPKLGRARKSTAADSTEVSSEAIATLAYERFCARGYQHGHDVEDWLAAERDLLARV